MFDPTTTPRVFYTVPGQDFAPTLVAGLEERLGTSPPHAWPRVDIFLNTQRSRKKLIATFQNGPPRLLPRIRLITEILDNPSLTQGKSATPALKQRLEIAQLVRGLLIADPRFGPASSAFDLAGSLVGLFDELHGEGIASETLRTLEVPDQSGHWDRALDFVKLVQGYFEQDDHISAEALQRFAVQALIQKWDIDPPQNPVIVAGSTGSRQTTFDLMCAVSKLPQGAIILPGFDAHMPDAVWTAIQDPKTSQDHPQYRYKKLMDALGMDPSQFQSWVAADPSLTARNRLLSLSLRPAPVTHHWFSEGPDLTHIDHACQDITWVETPDQKTESATIALRLRQAAQDGITAAVITPDRNLTRRITAQLARWNIAPDDSAGMPLNLSPPGRFMLHLLDTGTKNITTEPILTILKHPITHTGGDRGPHLKHSRDLELYLRKRGPAFPDQSTLQDWVKSDDLRIAWADWVGQTLFQPWPMGTQPLTIWMDHHLRIANALSDGATGDKGALWNRAAGRELASLITELQDASDSAGDLTFSDYRAIFANHLATGSVRDLDNPHPNILIWGALEARVQNADLVILAGLNEGSWPEPPSPDPWLNRAMRSEIGLLLPDRRIGLAAHDYQQAMGGAQVWITRSTKSDDAETVPSRWLNRFENLLAGLKDQGGPDALTAMKSRGTYWIDLARHMDRAIPTKGTDRPAPCPPIDARPRKMPVTDIKRLVRDPYSIYAKHVLRLRPLDPITRDPNAPLRGIVVHEILANFLKAGVPQTKTDALTLLLGITDTILAQQVPWPAVRRSWRAKIERFADWLVTRELGRQPNTSFSHTEIQGDVFIPEADLILNGRADRIDILSDGTAAVYDYKTGKPPTKDQQLHFDKQLLIESEMVLRGAFSDIGVKHINHATYIGLGAKPEEVNAPLGEADVWAEFLNLLRAYRDPDQGYTARRAMVTADDPSDYDHLSRFGEWDTTQPAQKQVVP